MSSLWGLLHSANALAQGALHAPEKQGEEKGAATGCAAGVQERFLRVEPQFVFLMHVGNRVTQNGKVLDSSSFSIIPDFAVNGSKGARAHLSRARIAHGAAFASFLTAIGLFVGAEVIRQEHEGRWTRASTAMGLSSIFTLLISFPFAHIRDWETFDAVNSYNHDLVNGKLDP